MIFFLEINKKRKHLKAQLCISVMQFTCHVGKFICTGSILSMIIIKEVMLYVPCTNGSYIYRIIIESTNGLIDKQPHPRALTVTKSQRQGRYCTRLSPYLIFIFIYSIGSGRAAVGPRKKTAEGPRDAVGTSLCDSLWVDTGPCSVR